MHYYIIMGQRVGKVGMGAYVKTGTCVAPTVCKCHCTLFYLRLRQSGRKIFVATNSDYKYTQVYTCTYVGTSMPYELFHILITPFLKLAYVLYHKVSNLGGTHTH